LEVEDSVNINMRKRESHKQAWLAWGKSSLGFIEAVHQW